LLFHFRSRRIKHSQLQIQTLTDLCVVVFIYLKGNSKHKLSYSGLTTDHNFLVPIKFWNSSFRIENSWFRILRNYISVFWNWTFITCIQNTGNNWPLSGSKLTPSPLFIWAWCVNEFMLFLVCSFHKLIMVTVLLRNFDVTNDYHFTSKLTAITITAARTSTAVAPTTPRATAAFTGVTWWLRRGLTKIRVKCTRNSSSHLPNVARCDADSICNNVQIVLGTIAQACIGWCPVEVSNWGSIGPVPGARRAWRVPVSTGQQPPFGSSDFRNHTCGDELIFLRILDYGVFTSNKCAGVLSVNCSSRLWNDVTFPAWAWATPACLASTLSCGCPEHHCKIKQTVVRRKSDETSNQRLFYVLWNAERSCGLYLFKSVFVS